MPTNDVVDPSVQEADQRAARAKESLLSRVEMLKQRFTDAKHRMSPKEQIAKYPIPAVGAAFALGVIAGRGRSRSAASGGEAGRSLGGVVVAGLAALVVRVVREAVLAQLAHAAHNWWAEQERQSPQASRSRTRDVEPFLEH